jgi:hypothetical protein
MSVRWFQIRSWHAVKFESRAGVPAAYCGRWGTFTTKVVEDLPGTEKSCETCLRLVARAAEQAE